MAFLKQGREKDHNTIKSKFLNLMFKQYLKSNPFDIAKPVNATYGTREIMAYFSEMSMTNRSGEHVGHSVFRKHEYELPKQQTVKDRLMKLPTHQLESNINRYLLSRVVNSNFFRPGFFDKSRLMSLNRDPSKYRVQEKTDKDNGDDDRDPNDNQPHVEGKIDEGKEKRDAKRPKLKERRLMQRERGIQRPDGLYLAGDPHTVGYYGEEDVELPNGENLRSYLVHRRTKASTNTFFQFHVIYSFEQGVRQILGFHLKRSSLIDEEWKEEPFANIAGYLLDPILAELEVKGFIGDGEYYNIDLIHYLLLKELDFVIRADWTDDLRDWCESNNLEEELEDGEGREVDGGRTIGRRKQAHDLRLVVVKRGKELVPLVLPQYSELTPAQALLLFEERFGIETNFREIELRMGFTSAHSPHYRIALFGTACSMYNLLLSYYERVVARSDNPSHWKVTLLDLMDQLHEFLGDYMIEAVYEVKFGKDG